MIKTIIILQELFYVLTVALCVFILLEVFWPGSVLAYLNLSWLLLFWLFNATFLIIFSLNSDEKA